MSDMNSNLRNRRFEHLVGVSLVVVVAIVLGVLLHAGMHPQIVA
jgi:hypothetical protein